MDERLCASGMIRIFIGYDTRESVAWHVAAHSIIRRTRENISLTPLGNSTLPRAIWWRDRGPHDSTEFSNARFLVPYLADFRGWAVFVDCDVLCLTDICDLIGVADPRYAVMLRKHQHVPQQSVKFLGHEQSRYRRKNWSSLMLLNCAHPACSRLTPEYVNEAPGLDLHGFAWCADDEIGEIGTLWNVLVDRREERSAVA